LSIFDLEAEQAVLGCILQGESPDAARMLVPSDFHLPAHAAVWRAMQGLLSAGQPIDELTLAERLKADGRLELVGGPAGIFALTSAAPVGTNLPAYVTIVRDRSLRRALVEKARVMAAEASSLSSDATAVALKGSAAFASLGAAGAVELPTLETAYAELCDDLQAIAAGTKMAALPTGIDVWDESLGGLQLGRLTCIGAYPSVGKSALKNRMIINLAQQGLKVGTFELEDPATALVRRAVAYHSGIPVRRLASERLPEFLMEKAGAAIQHGFGWANNVIYEARSGMSDAQVAATARQMVVQRGCKAIFVDHAGEMRFGAEHDRFDLAVSAGVRLLRDVAKDLGVAVVLLAHFHRPKSQTDKEPRFMRPTSAMWKNSGGFEEAARVAVGLWLDEDRPGSVVATVLKQTEGEKDFDFYMPMHQPSGLIESTGGIKSETRVGYHEGK
jgi:replicative DNA helicase